MLAGPLHSFENASLAGAPLIPLILDPSGVHGKKCSVKPVGVKRRMMYSWEYASSSKKRDLLDLSQQTHNKDWVASFLVSPGTRKLRNFLTTLDLQTGSFLFVSRSEAADVNVIVKLAAIFPIFFIEWILRSRSRSSLFANKAFRSFPSRLDLLEIKCNRGAREVHLESMEV